MLIELPKNQIIDEYITELHTDTVDYKKYRQTDAHDYYVINPELPAKNIFDLWTCCMNVR